MTRSERRQRTALVGVRLNPNEYARARRLAKALGLTIPDMFRRLLNLLAEGRTDGDA